MRFFDTNMLVYAATNQEPQKGDIARELIQHALEVNHDGCISTQVLQEFCNTMYKKTKRTKEEKDALNEVRKLAPKAVERLKQILEDSTVSKAILLKAIEIVFDRTYGKPEASVKVTSVQETLQESEAYVMAIVQRARNRLREETADE